MARSGDTEVTFNTVYFDEILQSAEIDDLSKAAAERALVVAKAQAPVDTHAYQRRLAVERRLSRYRAAWRVVGRDKKTMLVEAKTGNLARALKAAKQ